MIRMERSAGSAAHWNEERYHALFNPTSPRRFALVMEADGVAGFLIASAVDLEWEIENVVVRGEFHRRGFGRALVLDLLERARKAKATSVFLEVRESNVGARRLYQGLGFVQISHRPRYYSHPEENAIVYRFEIK